MKMCWRCPQNMPWMHLQDFFKTNKYLLKLFIKKTKKQTKKENKKMVIHLFFAPNILFLLTIFLTFSVIVWKNIHFLYAILNVSFLQFIQNSATTTYSWVSKKEMRYLTRLLKLSQLLWIWALRFYILAFPTTIP